MLNDNQAKLQKQTRIHTIDYSQRLNHIKSDAEKSTRTELLNEQKISNTQINIQSHSLVKKIIENCKQKVINYQKNHKIQIYKRYQAQTFRKQPKQPKILPENQASDCAKQIKTIYTQLTDQSPLFIDKLKKDKPRSYSYSETTTKPLKISLSGLISYKFHSIKSKKRLCFQQPEDYSKLNFKSKSFKKRKSQQIRSSNAEIEASDEQFGNFKYLSTNEYLRQIVKQRQNEKTIYGLKKRQLQCLKKMTTQVNSIDDACSLIEKIKQMASPIPKRIPHRKSHMKVMSKTIDQQQSTLGARKAPQAKNKVCLSRLFTKFDQ